MENVYEKTTLIIKLVKSIIKLSVALPLPEPAKVVDELPGACCVEGLGESVAVQRIEEDKSNISMVSRLQESKNHYSHHN